MSSTSTQSIFKPTSNNSKFKSYDPHFAFPQQQMLHVQEQMIEISKPTRMSIQAYLVKVLLVVTYLLLLL
jgi:hypothetical protein